MSSHPHGLFYALNALARTSAPRRGGLRWLGAGALATLPMLGCGGGGCAALSGDAVYLWHCTRDGLYSMYSSGVTGENFLRGVEVSDANGQVTFTTVFPGCYAGRMPHIHFEVYASLAAATSLPAGDQVRTSQIALPVSTCQEVYATSGYGASTSNLNRARHRLGTAGLPAGRRLPGRWWAGTARPWR